MQRLVSYESSSADSGESVLGRKKLKRIAACEESEVSSSVVEGDPNELIAESTGDPAMTLLEMGCSFEQVTHAISICGQGTKIPELFDFIQAYEYPTGEESNAPKIGVHEEDAQLQLRDPYDSPGHIANSCGGSTEIENLVWKTPDYVQGHRYTEEASCSRSHHVGGFGQDEDENALTMQKLQRMGFTPDCIQRASEDCNSIDFDVLLEYLVDAKEKDLHVQNPVQPEPGGLGHENQEENGHATPLQRLQRMGYRPALVQRASEECNSIDFDVLLEYLVEAEEEDLHLQDQVYSEVDSSEDEDDEATTVVKLQNMGFPYTAIKKAIDANESCDFEGLLEVLSTSENLKTERDFDVAGDGKQTLGEGSSASLLKKNCSNAEKVGTSRNKLAAVKWTGNMEKLWYTYIGSKKKSDPFLDLQESDDDMLQSPQEAKSQKLARSKRKSEFHDSKKVDIVRPLQGKMMGFGIPGLFIGRPKPLPYLMQGPPYFYFENVAGVPNNEWDTIKRHFNGVDPEFTDSLYFSASRRPRGYVHNLPVDDRSLLLCTPPMSIFEALPDTERYWPSWDTRQKLNCISTRKAPDSLCGLIRKLFSMYDGAEIPYYRQQEIVQACKKWNLVWVGPGQTAPLEPHEIELLQGFDRDHTRGCSSITERYDALGNSFQVNTVAYHLSPLKVLYPDGITVLSLFSGIGGAEVALDKLGIHLKVVIAVEINEKVRGVLASWWKKSGQMGELKLRNDVRDLTHDALSDLIDEVGRIDLIIGGSPCNNLSGNNRVSRVGLNGSESSLFFEFPRILTIVTQVMRNRGFI
eukprot:c24103_g1_i1 orf=250-2667(+)